MTKPKTIVVTGASRGIGMELVKLFAQDKNNTVLALSRNVEKMDEAFAGFENIKSAFLDLNSKTVKEDCIGLFSEFDQIDILVNNAGMLVNKPFTELTREDIESCYSVNIISVMETVQAVIPKMDTGHIVNISSMGGFQGSVKFAGLSAYSTSKAALCSFTELFSEEYKDTNIAMNCLCLGAAQTEMLEEAFPGYEAPVNAKEMAEFIASFALNSNCWIKGKIIPVSLSTP